jgi:cell division protein FtsB
VRSTLASWLVRLALAAIVAGALAYIPYRVYGEAGYVRYRKLDDQQGDLTRGNQRLIEENRQLSREISLLRSDPDAVRRAAREELGMIAPGEIIIKIEPASAESRPR